MWWLNCNHKRFIKLVVEGRTRDIFFWGGGLLTFFFLNAWCCVVGEKCLSLIWERKIVTQKKKPPNHIHTKREREGERKMSQAAKKLIPLLDRVLVERAVAATKTSGGILLPETVGSKVRFLLSLSLVVDFFFFLLFFSSASSGALSVVVVFVVLSGLIC